MQARQRAPPCFQLALLRCQPRLRGCRCTGGLGAAPQPGLDAACLASRCWGLCSCLAQPVSASISRHCHHVGHSWVPACVDASSSLQQAATRFLLLLLLLLLLLQQAAKRFLLLLLLLLLRARWLLARFPAACA